MKRVARGLAMLSGFCAWAADGQNDDFRTVRGEGRSMRRSLKVPSPVVAAVVPDGERDSRIKHDVLGRDRRVVGRHSTARRAGLSWRFP